VLGEDVWVTQWLRKLPPGNVVVPDVRFGNEAETIWRMGGILIRVHRGGSQDSHVSEQQVFAPLGPIYAVSNTGTVQDLHEAVLKIVAGHYGLDAIACAAPQLVGGQ